MSLQVSSPDLKSKVTWECKATLRIFIVDFELHSRRKLMMSILKSSVPHPQRSTLIKSGSRFQFGGARKHSVTELRLRTFLTTLDVSNEGQLVRQACRISSEMCACGQGGLMWRRLCFTSRLYLPRRLTSPKKFFCPHLEAYIDHLFY